MRLFVAINLPSDLRRDIWRASEPLRREKDVRWVAESGLHLTLRFLGETAPDAAGSLGEAVNRASGRHAPFRMRLGGLGAFPSMRKPRVVWLGIERSAALERLHADVQTALAAEGLEPDTRAFRPHLTLGRARRDAPIERIAERVAGASSIDLDRTAAVEAVDLMRSELGPGGARYSVVRACPLRG